MNQRKIALVAGGTGGHIFPALAVALEWKSRFADRPIVWIGTTRNRERELCGRNAIDLFTIDVQGMERRLSVRNLVSLVKFVKACIQVRSLFKRENVGSVLAFGGYVSVPALLAARTLGLPLFLQEQNTVAGWATKVFSRSARCIFLGFPLHGAPLKGRSILTGTPIRPVSGIFNDTAYPAGFDRSCKTILICGGSQGAQSMNRFLVAPVAGWLRSGCQVVWQTGEAGFQEIRDAVGPEKGAFIFPSIGDLYPFYAASRVVVGRSGASTLSEIAYFGLPCVLLPLPWATENHQWKNAALAQGQGWAVRIRQADGCGEAVDEAVRKILDDDARFELMSRNALEHSPATAAAAIVTSVAEQCYGEVKS